MATAAVVGFYLRGRNGSSGPAGVPPFLYYYRRDLARLRYDYPVCVTEQGAVPLRKIVDDLAAAAPGADLLPLEAAVKAASEKSERKLSELWVAAAGPARPVPKVDGPLLSCDAELPLRLVRAAAAQTWLGKAQSLRADLDDLTHRLNGLLRSDADPTATSLAETKELDAAAFASVLARHRSGPALSERRRERIRQALETLRGFHSSAAQVPPPVETPAEASRALGVTLKIMGEAFRAVRIARLETGNRYREDVHDVHFRALGPADLSEEEIALCPPVILSVKDGSLDAADRSAILDLLASPLPVKILLRVSETCEADETGLRPSWGARVAATAVGQGGAFVLQTPASSVTTLAAGLLEGMRAAGPALFSVFVGKPSELPPYLVAAAALESRVFPAFTYRPGKDWADAFSIEGNPQPEKPWPTGPLAYKGVTSEQPFTPADFFAADPATAGHYLPIEETDPAVPVAEFLAGAPEGKVPFVLIAAPDGTVRRAVVTRAVVRLARRFRSAWRALQESAGIDSSLVKKRLAEEGARVEAEKRRDVAEVEKKHQTEWGRAMGDVTQEIVRRIAGGLLGTGGEVPVLSAAPSAPKVETPKRTDPVPPPAQKEEEEELSTGEPYIDGALCTSCDECTKRNGMMFAYDENKRAYIKDVKAGPFRDLVQAAEKCPVGIIHPGKPKDPDEPGLAEWVKRAEKFNK